MKFLVIPFFFLLWSNSHSVKSYSGKAFDMSSKEFLYQENHQELFKENTQIWITKYTSSDGSVLRKREITINKDSLRPNYKLEDLRTGYIEGSKKISPDTLVIFRRLEKLEKEVLKIDSTYIVDAGLTYFFRKNWSTLLHNKKVYFNFVAPARLDYYKFRVYKNRIYDINKRKVVELILEPSSFILRQFVDPILVSYYLDNKEIVLYKGISNVSNNKGDNYDVLISYLKKDEKIWNVSQ